MKPSARPPANLSDSTQHRLHCYVLMATATGVGLLALNQATEAKIVYTPADKSITPNHTIPVDLNHDGTIDFRIRDAHFTSQTYGFDHTGILSVLPAHPGNRIQGFSRTARHYASALNPGASIGPKGRFTPGPKIMATVFSDTGANRGLSNSCNGPWSKAQNRYLGLKFLIESKIHFGWARLSVTCRGTDVLATLTGYAYETVTNKLIIAGKTEGPDQGDGNEEQSDTGASLTNPIPVTPRASALGVLALGARGVPLWRRKELALEGD